VSSLIVLTPGNDWAISSGLFDWTLEYLIGYVSDDAVAERLQEIVDNNLGSLWISEFSSHAQKEIYRLLQEGIVAAGKQDLPDGDHKALTLRRLEELAGLARARLAAME
jgi:hypothetical protein